MTPVQSAGILTLIINSRGPNYQIKSVMSGLTINNHSILETSGGELELLCNLINFRNTTEFVKYRDDNLNFIMSSLPCYEGTIAHL